MGVLRQRLGRFEPQVGIVLGSGLGGLAGAVDRIAAIAYRDIPGMPEPTVPGHSGEFIAGTLERVPVILQNGRLHLYEGHPPDVVALPLRLMAGLGIETLIVTNAAGGLDRSARPPVLMLITDHLNLTGRSPLVGPVLEGETRFPDMSAAYDPDLRAAARKAAAAAGLTLKEGVYAALLGPSFETPAEIRMLETLGAHAVGMSTVPEVIAARARGIRVLGISTITNLAAGISPTPLSHEEVLEAGQVVARDLERLVRGVLRIL
ncbi:MAG TPA: purine-nucleoside phosphorylase [Gemmatimonadales bacterium]|nr:purine-nucleoside phosphorylase [Gemmatimonadales bacterium]